MTPAQERAVANGIQPHSIGGPFPYSVVGIGNGGQHCYEVRDLRTNEIAVSPTGRTQWEGTEKGASMAGDIASAAVQGRLPPGWRFR